MTHVFKDYGPGVRFIRFTHGGQDTQYWAGWYGIRVINSSVEICPAAEQSRAETCPAAEQSCAETFKGAGAQSMKGAHGTRFK